MFHTSKKRVNKKIYRPQNSSNKRGQFTIFVILGLIIFMIFAFAVYAKVKIINSMLGQQADIQLKNYLSDNEINQYVNNCLDAVVDETIITASMQGGLLNSSGLTPNVDYVEYYSPEFNRTFNVSVVIDANTNCPDGRNMSNFVVSQIPGPYPLNPLCANDYVSNLPSKYLSNTGNCANTCTRNDFRKFSGFFGVNNMSMLCDPNGANSPTLPGINGPNTCEYYSYYRESMQQLLEDKITNDINVCVNFTEILSKTPSNITEVGSVNTTIQFGKGDFSVKLEYPFTILMRNRQPVTRLVNFGVTKEIPFKELYEYTYELANYDVKNASFEIQQDKNKVYSKGSANRNMLMYNWYYKINIIDGNATNNFIRIIQVIDTLHNITGVPLTINFAVKNRAPVLDYINNGQSKLYDLVAVENRTILISPQGYDPDDDQLLTYTYGGWLEQYTDYYNFSDHNCSAPSSLEYILENCTKENLTDHNPPHNWTKSALFIATGKNASYDASSLDIGLHNVIVSVLDSHGLYDFQTVRILVFDLPIARINGSNDYDDVDKHRASYEDRYLLNGAESTVGVIESATGAIFNTFIWTDPDEPFIISKHVDNTDLSTKQLLLPNESEFPSPAYDILNITQYFFKNETDAYKIHNITLTVITSNDLSNINTFYVNVTQCLNHSNPSNKFPYPYNNNPNDLLDALNATHICCTDYMTYAGTSTECFWATRYGMINSFENYSTRQNSPPATIDLSYNYNGFSRYDNDIFEQTFTRNCSSNRGNICTGNAAEVRLDVESCDDYNGFSRDTAFNKERCSGPSESGPSQNQIYCMNYSSGTTFDTKFLGVHSGGICTSSPQCSNGNIFEAYDNTQGPYKYTCDGQCSGSDGKCNKPTNCVCDSSCAPNTLSSISSPLCDGLSGSGTPKSISCDVGQPYLADTCSGCGLTDTSTCIYNLAAGCTVATEQCNNIRQGDAFANNNINCIPGTSQKARCSIDCQLTPDFDSSCTTVGNECIGASQCNGIIKDNKINSIPNDNSYCDNNCFVQTCNIGQKYIVASHTCNNDCRLNNIGCNNGYTCCNGINCNGINAGSCILTPT